MTKLPILLVWLAVVLIIAACAGETGSTPSAALTEPPEPKSSPTPIATSPAISQAPTFTATAAPRSTPDPDASYSRRTPFVPLDNPALLSVEGATYLRDDELVLGMEWGNEARAYPVSMLTYHHIVNDTVGGRPFLITY